MLVACDCWEYDIKAAGKTFLESLGYKLPDKKEDYVVRVGLTFKDRPDLQKQFYDELKHVLLDQLPPDINILRYYVDEVVTDKRVKIPSDKYTIKEKHIRFMLLENPTTFVKVYDDSVKVSKSLTLQSERVWKDIADIYTSPLKRNEKQKKLVLLVKKFLNQKYEPKDYIVVTRQGRKVIVYKTFIQDANHVSDRFLEEINKEAYYKILFKYLHLLI